jgi:hypothetical protein
VPNGSYPLQCNQHLYGTDASQASRDITLPDTDHHTWAEWMSDEIWDDSQKTEITVQYLDNLAPIDKLDMLVVPI